MGFFQGLGRVFQGKPIFQEDEDGATTTHSDADGSHQEHDGIIKNDTSTFPVLRIEDFNPDISEHEYALRVTFKNEWHFPIIVQTVKALGQTHTIGKWLQPEQTAEVLIYEGHPFTQQPNTEISIEYKTEHEGDYFQALHTIKYMYKSGTKTYEVSDIQLHLPIRDIYG